MNAVPDHASSARMISYAQNAEDMVLWRVFAPKTDGFYIDVGANHPVTDNVTKHFYDRGWHGINIEPLPSLHRALESQRPRDVNLCVGVGDAPGMLEFTVVRSNEALSTFHAELDARHADDGHATEKRSVPITTLAEICREHVTGEIDFLKVDVEGYEAQVFRGHDWDRFRPRVIVAEDNFAHDWSALVESKGYTQLLHDGLNRFFMRDDVIPELGHLLDRPAVIAIDGYDPWRYIEPLDALRSRLFLHRLGATRVGRWARRTRRV